ncbi:hypothetical protein Kpol_541p8 [Vanderwaltozyma polyspora DSM 70294]|uniref:Signal recognition particle SEC65 subunit n=1 Tax=Vanderwaltozyma polyspora (strain ATCC 22028 / DSM 70294 / BCRC 21397 / CBS 2163 / NBRC 10782 / NRRL Y-8283 / UCD 57-17) TaxID=436907 RepID=A7TIV3_VANPO|nr:uncharacterized protein Kpol_541p8 [Vanderwaltozyma polyspora DSM 70294]EDO17765.1 hypothetical protein Kpol_541p8 [Vanderwaltozyma polyspora DSM 70294]
MPKLEEIDDYNDIDNLEMDLAELDPTLKTPIAPKIVPTVVRSQDEEEERFKQQHQQQQELSRDVEKINFINPQTGKIEGTTTMSRKEMEEIKGFQVLYPCYFDKNRSHKEGRRVPKALAVENPLAKTLADAVRDLGLLCIFEGEKCHPQDFGNPGRVRVLLKENGELVSSANQFKGGKRQLMKKISEFLQKNPTTIEKLREIPYGSDFDNIEFKRIPKVKGFKMNDIVPLHSPYLMGHPMCKSIYEAPPAPVAGNDKPMKLPKNKYKVIRR